MMLDNFRQLTPAIQASFVDDEQGQRFVEIDSRFAVESADYLESVECSYLR